MRSQIRLHVDAKNSARGLSSSNAARSVSMSTGADMDHRMEHLGTKQVGHQFEQQTTAMTKWRDEPVHDAEQGGLPGKKYSCIEKQGRGPDGVGVAKQRLLAEGKVSGREGRQQVAVQHGLEDQAERTDLTASSSSMQQLHFRREVILADASGPKSEAGQDDLCTCFVGALARLELFEHTVAALHDAATPSCNPLQFGLPLLATVKHAMTLCAPVGANYPVQLKSHGVGS